MTPGRELLVLFGAVIGFWFLMAAVFILNPGWLITNLIMLAVVACMSYVFGRLTLQPNPPRTDPEIHSFDPSEARAHVTVRWPDGQCLHYALDDSAYTDQPQVREATADRIVLSVMQRLSDHSAAGIQKYGTTMERTDLQRVDWLRHAQEELLDGAVYLERLIRDEQGKAP